MNNSSKMLKVVFWIFTLSGLGVILHQFFWAVEKPMEWKILVVFCIFSAGAGVYRWIRKKSEDEQLNRWIGEAVEWSDTGISAVALAFVIMAFILQAFKIPSGSMTPTLLIGDHLFVNKFIYGPQIPFTLKRPWKFKEVQRGDVVVFLCPPRGLSDKDRENNVKKDFIKRCVALAGDTVEIRNKVLFVNGAQAEDPYASFKNQTPFPKVKIFNSPEEYQSKWENGEFAYIQSDWIIDNFGPVTVPPKSFFVLGDNRDGSFDSRFWGPLPEEYLKGCAWVVYWPFSRLKIIR